MSQWFRVSTATVFFAAAAGAAPVAVVNPGFEDLYFGSNLPAMYNGDVPAGTFPVGPPPAGWTAYTSTGSAIPNAFIGVLNPGRVIDDGAIATFFPAGAPEGDNAVLLYHGDPAGGAPYGVTQVLAATLEPHTRYTLTVAVGNIDSGIAFVPPFSGFGYYDIKGFPGYQVQLRAGGAFLAQDDSSLTPGEGVFETSSVVFTTGANHAQLGSQLEIWLVSLNQATTEPAQTGVEVDFDDVQLDATPLPVAVPIGPAARWLIAGALLVAGAAARRGTRRG